MDDLFPGFGEGRDGRPFGNARDDRGNDGGRATHPLLAPLWDPSARVLVGTSGFRFADWVGPFYPRGFTFRDMLPFYSRRFPAVEINATYYRIPPPRTCAQMARRTPPGFRFVVKAHRSMTHDGRLDAVAAGAFRACVEPLAEAGKLAGVLAQFPFAFRNTSDHRRHLLDLSRVLPPVPRFVEFRHASWARPATLRFLDDHGLGFVAVDEPALPGLMPPVIAATSPAGYVRMHGRNARAWWGRSGVERYHYRYSTPELSDWARKIEDLAGRTERVFVFMNNCHGGNAARNAIDLEKLVARELTALTDGALGARVAAGDDRWRS